MFHYQVFSPNRRSFVSGHANGSIIVYSFESRTQTKICVHSTAPYCLVHSNSSVLAAGADRRIISYSIEHGRILQDFDYSTSDNNNNKNLFNDSNTDSEKEFYAAVADASAHNIIFATFNRLRLMCWNQRRGAWDEGRTLNLRNFYTPTALAWKSDGTTIVAGNCVGAVILIDCCMKRALLKNRFETTYISPSQIVITDTKPDSANSGSLSMHDNFVTSKCVIRSSKNYAITNLRVLSTRNGQRHICIGHTSYTMILADIQSNLCSEIVWDWSGNERFYVENENVCMIVNAGEISFVEYGRDTILGWIRTERVNPHLISIRVSEGAGVGGNNGSGRLSARGDLSGRTIKRRLLAAHVLANDNGNLEEQATGVCRVAYLLDIHTISLVNLVNNAQIAVIPHTNAIDWIELNESGNKLLFRDIGSSVFLYIVETQTTRNLLNYCSYVQWVPQSDAIVAQSGEMLCIWYNSDDSSMANSTMSNNGVAEQNAIRFPIQGDIEMVLRDENHTEVIVVENNARVAYELDGAMIEFGTALNNLDLSRALIFLERCEQQQQQQQLATSYNNDKKINNLNVDNANELSNNTYELSSMWQRLAKVALQNMELLIAQRCFASLNDFPKVRFLQETIESAERAFQIGLNQRDSSSSSLNAATIANYFGVRARIALLNKDFKAAERIFLENNAIEESIEMYQKLNNWEAAIELAKAMRYTGLNSLKDKYYRYMNETGQLDKAAEIRMLEGDVNGALHLYLESNRPGMAAKTIMENNLFSDSVLVDTVVQTLLKNELYDKAGELLEATKNFDAAIQAFHRGKFFGKAIQIARVARPDEVILLEKEWGDDLFSNGNFDGAISHYLESGNNMQAAESAIQAKEWMKAIEILNSLNSSLTDNTDSVTHKQISQFYLMLAQHFEAEGQYEKAEKFYLDGNHITEAIEMYNKAGHWVEAHKLAVEFFGADESNDLYAQKAESLKRSGRLVEAESLYISIGQQNNAIAMYKETNRFNDMIRLVERYHPENVLELHKRLAEELEEKKDFKGAEEHYLASGNLSLAIEMYKEAEQWSDAYRVAKAENNERVQKQVAYLWAKSLGGDSAVKLLTRFGLLQEAIEIGISKSDFDFLFELCNFGAKTRLKEIQQKYAEHLEDESDFTKAEEFYLKADKGREAVLMYIHDQNWDAAERVASLHSTDMVNEVYVVRARAALEIKQLPEAESYLLRACRADIILNYYCEMGLWVEAMRIASKYLPNMLEQVQNEYEEAQLRSGAKGAQLFMVQAAEWEQQSEYRRAVDSYLKVNEFSTDDVQMITHAQIKAGELIVKFLRNDNEINVREKVDEIGARLINLGQFNDAAEVFLMAEMVDRALEAFIAAKEWTKAQRIAAELSPEMIEHVDKEYREFLRSQGRVGDLIDVDVVAAIDLLAERRQWDTALSTAQQQNHRPLLDKYLVMYVTELIEEDRFFDAVKLFNTYGTSTNTQNFNIYKKLIDCLVNDRNCDYETFASLRNMVFDLNRKLDLNKDNVDERIIKVFERYQYILHFYALNKAIEIFINQSNRLTNNNVDDDDIDDDSVGDNSLNAKRLRLKQSIAMLRYVDLLQPDKVFYEAGNACKEFGNEYENLGFVLLNHFLDIVDAIEENDPSMVDNSLFDGTDVPQAFAIPNKIFLSTIEYEEIKEWVLATSVGQNIVKELKTDEQRDNCYEASTIDLHGNSYPICLISGYPVTANEVKVGVNNGAAEATNWQIFTNILRTQQSDELFDVSQFLTRWSI